MNSLVLVIPPSPFLADERVFPSLGILKVASAMEMQGVPVDVLDLSGIGNYIDVLGAYIASNPKLEVVGITATSPQFPHAVEISQTSLDKGLRTVVGGPHPTMVGSAFKLDQRRGIRGRGTMAFEQMVSLFSTCVIGDGELAMLQAMKQNGVIFADDNKSDLFLKRGTLDDYPMPARHLIDMSSYHYQIDGRDAQSMIAQLGCPFYCLFCGGRNTHSFRAIRNRTPEAIVAEVDVLVKKYGKRGIMFYDDELNVSNASLIPLLEELIRYQEKNKLDLRLRGFVKAELFTAEQAHLMYRAGFRIMLSGVESGDDFILKVMRKRTTREINSRWVRLCHEAGLKAKALMSIGHAGETRQSVLNSLEWVLSNKPDDVDWTVITQYPGSPYFDESVLTDDVWVFTDDKTGAVLYSKEIDYAKGGNFYKGVPGDYTSFVWTDELSPEELVELRDHCEAVSRQALGLSPIVSIAEKQFEHSMGQSLPRTVLRSS